MEVVIRASRSATPIVICFHNPHEKVNASGRRREEGQQVRERAGATCACFSVLKAIVPSLLLLLLLSLSHAQCKEEGGDMFQQQMHRLC